MTIITEDTATKIDRGRYRKILWFFSMMILHLVWWDLLVGRILKGPIRRSRPKRFRRMSRRFRHLAIEMGGVMIKLGQFLSARVDVLPPEITEELAGLQDEVPPVAFEDIQAVLTAELGNISDHFSYFEPVPVAAASLGQAHHARLTELPASENGHGDDPVVVKVQRPQIEEIVRTDLAALDVVARWTMRYPPIRRRADVPALMKEFSVTLWEELDYVSEAGNAERFANMFEDNPEVRIPAVYRRHSTGRVLVLEDVSGIKITDIDSLVEAGVDPGEVALRLLDVYFQQIFKEGFFHADPHPGNLFIQPIGDRRRSRNTPRPFILTFVDFGMVGHVEQLRGETLRRVLISVTQRDAMGLTRAYNDLGFFLPGADLDRIAEAQEIVLDHLWGRNLLELNQPDPEEIQELSREFKDLIFEFPFQVPQDFVFLGRALGMLSGLASMLDPTINPWKLVEQYGREFISSQEGRAWSMEALTGWLRLLVTLPPQAQRVFNAAESGRLKVRMVPDKTLLRKLDKIEKKVSRPNWSLLAAAMVVCSTLFYINTELDLAAVAGALALLFLILAIVR